MRFEFLELGKHRGCFSLEKLEKREKRCKKSAIFTKISPFPLFFSIIHSISTAAAGLDASEIERRITEAAEAARAEGEAGLEDLLVCLGEVRHAFTRVNAPFCLRSALTIAVF